MAVLDSCPKHNMVAYLEKSEGNAEFHEIIDFLKRSSIHHALTLMGKVLSSERPSEHNLTPSPAPTVFRSSQGNTRLEVLDQKAQRKQAKPVIKELVLDMEKVSTDRPIVSIHGPSFVLTRKMKVLKGKMKVLKRKISTEEHIEVTEEHIDGTKSKLKVQMANKERSPQHESKPEDRTIEKEKVIVEDV
ncbi:hypothetical protein Tco_0540350 [Tanacetum coccineum]